MQDVLLDDTYSFIIGDGDFLLGDSTQQEIQLILYSEQGDWKFSPFTGVGLRRALLGPVQPQRQEALINTQLIADGMQVQAVSVLSSAKGQIIINTKATRPS